MSIFSREKHDIKAIKRELIKEDSSIQKALHKNFIDEKDMKEFVEHRIKVKKLEKVLEKDFDKIIDKKFAITEEVRDLTNMFSKCAELEKLGNTRKDSVSKWAQFSRSLEEEKSKFFKFLKLFNISEKNLLDAIKKFEKIVESQIGVIGEFFEIEKMDKIDLDKAKAIDSRSRDAPSTKTDVEEIALTMHETILWTTYYKNLKEQLKHISEKEDSIISYLKDIENKARKLRKLEVEKIPDNFRGTITRPPFTIHTREGIGIDIAWIVKILQWEIGYIRSDLYAEKSILKKLRRLEKTQEVLEKLELKHKK